MKVDLSGLKVEDLLSVSPGTLRTVSTEDSIAKKVSHLSSLDVPRVVIVESDGAIAGDIGGMES